MGELSSISIDRLNDVETMQYIGLQDVNGKEIYEGDIVKWGHIKGGEEDPMRIAIVDPDIQFHIVNYKMNFLGHFTTEVLFILIQKIGWK